MIKSLYSFILISCLIICFLKSFVGCSDDPASSQKSGVSDVAINHQSTALSDTVASYWQRGINFFKIYKEEPHPDVFIKDTTWSYFGHGETKFFFRGQLIKTYPHIFHSGGSVPRSIYGGWVNPNMYILAIQTTYPAMYYGAVFDFWIIKGDLATKPILIPKTTEPGYYSKAIFESTIAIYEARIFEDKIVFHSKPGYANETFSMFVPSSLSFVNCYRTFHCCDFVQYNWQW